MDDRFFKIIVSIIAAVLVWATIMSTITMFYEMLG